MIFRLVAIGRIRDSGLRAAGDDYQNRLKHYIRFDLLECPDGGRGDATTVRRREGESILRNITDKATVVALTRGGQTLDSRAFAEEVTRWHEAARDVVFVIGGAHGLSDQVLQRADQQLSLSAMTWPHELARLLFLEQLYRANTIRRGEPYHKGD